MSTSYIQPGETMTFTAPVGGVSADTPVLIGSLLVVPIADADAAASFAGYVSGVHYGVKAAGSAWTEGMKVYWDDGNSRFTHDSAAGQLAGVASAAATSAAVVGYVRLDGVSHAAAEGAQAAIVSVTDSSGYSGTHDDTVAAMAAIVDVTDSTGLDGTHDDTVAALNGLTDYTAHAAGSTPVTSNAATDLDTTASGLATLEDECAADFAVVNQNVSDLSQKMSELVAREAVAAQNISDVAQKVQEIIVALRAYGVIST